MQEELTRLEAHEADEVRIESALSYTSDKPVVIRVRRGDHGYQVDDDAGAVGLAGEPEGWLEIADGIVKSHGVDIDERGMVFVPDVVGRDLPQLVLGVADTSLSLYTTLVQAGDAQRFDAELGIE